MIKLTKENQSEAKMSKKQKWSVEIDGVTHTVEYRSRTLFSRARIKIDGSEYPLYSAKLHGASCEPFMVGGEPATISIARGGRASITVSGEIIPE